MHALCLMLLPQPPLVPLTWWLQQAPDALILFGTRLGRTSRRPQWQASPRKAEFPARKAKSNSAGAGCRCLCLVQQAGRIEQQHALHSALSEQVSLAGTVWVAAHRPSDPLKPSDCQMTIELSKWLLWAACCGCHLGWRTMYRAKGPLSPNQNIPFATAE